MVNIEYFRWLYQLYPRVCYLNHNFTSQIPIWADSMPVSSSFAGEISNDLVSYCSFHVVHDPPQVVIKIGPPTFLPGPSRGDLAALWLPRTVDLGGGARQTLRRGDLGGEHRQSFWGWKKKTKRWEVEAGESGKDLTGCGLKPAVEGGFFSSEDVGQTWWNWEKMVVSSAKDRGLSHKHGDKALKHQQQHWRWKQETSDHQNGYKNGGIGNVVIFDDSWCFLMIFASKKIEGHHQSFPQRFHVVDSIDARHQRTSKLPYA